MKSNSRLTNQHTFFLTLIAMMMCVLTCAANHVLANEIDFARDVEPILQKHCAACHNEDDNEGGFIATSYASLMEGASIGEVIVAGESGQSPMYRLMTGEDEPLMPPDDHPRPSEKELATIEAWIDAGAAGPAEDAPPVADATPMKSLDVPALGAAKGKMGGRGATAAAWSPTSGRLAVGSFSKVTISAIDSKQLVQEFNGLPGKVNSLRYSSDGTLLIAATGVTGQSGTAIVWDVDSGKVVQTLIGHSDTLYAAAISADNKTIATASYDRKIILWDVESGKQKNVLTGHNGAVFDLDFSPDSSLLVSASADQTLKLWDTANGRRIETLGEPLKEQLVCRFSPDGTKVFGAGRDNMIRVWRHGSETRASDASQLEQSVFAHTAPIFYLEFSADGSRLITTSEDYTTKVWDATTLTLLSKIENESRDNKTVSTATAMSTDGKSVFLGALNSPNRLETVTEQSPISTKVSTAELNLKPDAAVEPAPESSESEPNDIVDDANSIESSALIMGKIKSTEDASPDADLFSFPAKRGLRMLIQCEATDKDSKVDPHIEILDSAGKSVPRVRLQAVRESYLDFRGKNSDGIDNFRVHNWREMKINNFLYCNGEVVKLYQHPRGPDSGFDVYPGFGKRYGYFGTTPMAHPINEPCYIVEPMPVDGPLTENGLPVFTINYENDDASLRDLGTGARLLFDPPSDGDFVVRVRDVRGESGEDFKYKLTVRAARPGFKVTVKAPEKINLTGGVEFELTAKRIDGFDGPIEVNIEGIPDGLSMTESVVIQAGQVKAFGTIHVVDNELKKADTESIKCAAVANEPNTVEGWKPIDVSKDEPKIRLRVVKPETTLDEAFAEDFDKEIKFQIRPGERLEAKVVAQRLRHRKRISFGMVDAGRNLPRGVYIDDIGLNGLMIIENSNEQRFFITCDEWVEPQTCKFHVKANDVDNQTSWPVTIEVLPAR